MKILLGHKIGMTQFWDDNGKLTSATVIKAEPNKVIKEGKESKIATAIKGKTHKPQAYLAKLLGTDQNVWVKSVKDLTDQKGELDVTQFTKGDVVAISGVTKGKGFAGTIKRHNFHRGPVSHGSHNIRQPGSIGAQRPQRVPRGQKMAGRMGGVNFTARGNKVLAIDSAENLLVVSGAVPGPNRSKVVIQGINND